MSDGTRTYLPGVLALVVVALVAVVVAQFLPYIKPLLLTIALGALLANIVDLPSSLDPGLSLYKLLLETAIVLLGASVSLGALVTAGPVLVGLVILIVGFGVLLVTALTRVAGLGDRLGSLLAAGASICGVSAIAAVAPTCKADETHIAHAAGTILVFDALTLVAFPAIGRLLAVDGRLFGIWIGLSMFSTEPVAAAGFAHSGVAGRWATLTKLARNTLIGVVALAYSLHYTGQSGTHAQHSLHRV
jgi:uncharacterized integral membrane protein (TIGR00698 family)